MGKRSRKRPPRSEKDPPRSEKDPTGCIGGLINMFDFRQGNSSTKLLSDRKCHSDRHFAVNYSKDRVQSLGDIRDNEELIDVDDNRKQIVNSAKKSVKTLVEEDMSIIHHSKRIPSEEIDRIPHATGLEINLQKTYKQRVSDLVNDLKKHTRMESQKSNGMDPTERSSLNFDLAAFMIKLYDGEYQCLEKHLGCKSKDDPCNVSKTADGEKDNHYGELDFELVEKQIILHKSLVDVANVFLSQKLTDPKHPTGELQPQEFMDALEILNTNKDLLLSFLQDPNSLLLKLVQDHQNVQVGKLTHLESGRYSEATEVAEGIGSSGQHEAPSNQNHLKKHSGYKLFRKKDKSKREMSSERGDSSRALDKIVILKPRNSHVQKSLITASPSSSSRSHNSLKFQEDSERVASHFSLTEIKRRLQKVIGRKERRVISMEGVLDRIPYGSNDTSSLRKDSVHHALASKTSYDTQYNSLSPASRIGDENDEAKVDFLMSRLNKAATGQAVTRDSFNEEAKKHLALMLDTRDNNVLVQKKGVSKSLGRLLSLAEYGTSPRFCPGSERGTLSSETPKEDDATNHLSLLRHHLEKMACTEDNPVEKADVVDVNPELIDTQIREETCNVEESQKGSIEMVAEANIISRKECDLVSVNSESDCNVNGITRCAEDGLPAYSGQGSAQESSPATPHLSETPCSSLLKQMFKDPARILNMSEQPSPVSVLEPLFSGDVNAAGSELDESPIRSQTHMPLEEHAKPEAALTSSFEAKLQTCVDSNAGIIEYVKLVLELVGLDSNEISDRWLLTEQLIDPSVINELRISDSHLPDDPELLFDFTSEVLMEIQERFSCSPWVSLLEHNVRPIPIGKNLIQEVCKVIERHIQWPSPCTLDHIMRKDIHGRSWMELQSDTEGIVMETGNAILEDLIEEAAFEMWV